MTKREHAAAAPDNDQGFTLVELAIVLVIIGLIIGGVLRGQEMIESARMKSGISQIDALRAAHITFEDKYGGVPGDLFDASNVIAGAVAWTGCGSTANICDGDGVIDGGWATGEALLYWQHLAAAGMISGVEIATAPTATFGQFMPSFAPAGGFRVAWTRPTAADAFINYYTIATTPTAVAATGGGLVGEVAYEIDQKIDDGRPTSGDVRQNATPCNSGDAYNRASGSNCFVFIAMP